MPFIPPPRVPPLPYQLNHVTPHVTSPSHSTAIRTDHMDAEPDDPAQKESLKLRELQEILSDPSNYTQLVAGEEAKAGMNEELSQIAKESEIILERIDQQLLELGPFAKDTFLSPPIAPKDDFQITFVHHNYVPYSSPGVEMVPTGTGARSRRRGCKPGPPNQGTNGKTKRNSRGSETGSASSPMASTPVELRMDLGSEGLKEREIVSPMVAKEPPKSKWRKVGSAGSATKPPMQSRSSSSRLQNNVQSPILDRLSVLSPPVSSLASVMHTSVSPPTSSKSQQSSSISSPTIIPAASDLEMRSLFSNSNHQWELVESPPQQDRDRSSTNIPSNQHHDHQQPHAHHHHHHIAVHGRASVERGDSLLIHSSSSLVAVSHTSDNREPQYCAPTLQGVDSIRQPLSRPHSHSSSPPNSHLTHTPHHPHHPPSRSNHQPSPPQSDIHALLASSTGAEISRHLVSPGGMVSTSRPNISIAHTREAQNRSPLVTSAVMVNEERTPHANLASPLSEHSKGWVHRSSASPSLSNSGFVDSENSIVDRKRRDSSTSTSSHRSVRLHSFDDSGAHQRSSPSTTKPPPSATLPQQHGHGQPYGIDQEQKQQPPPGGTETTKLGAAVNPYAAALWGAASGTQFPAPSPGQVVDPVSSTTVPRFPFPPTAAPFLPGTNWIPTHAGGMIAAAPSLPPVRPAMLPFDPNSPYRGPLLGAPFLAAAPYRYSLPSGPGLKAFPGLAGISAGSSPGTSSQPCTPTATMAMPFSQPALFPGSTLSAFKNLNDPSVSNCSSPPTLHPQQLIGVSSGGNKDDKPQLAGGIGGNELPSMDKLPGLNMIPPPSASAAAALMTGANPLNLMPYLGMNQMSFSLGGIPPASIGQHTPGGVSLFNPHLSTLAAAGVHTGSEGNLTALGTAKESAALHRGGQRRGSAASIDMGSLPGHNESPPNQAKKGLATPASVSASGKWKPVTDNSPPVSQMLFNMSASPSAMPFAPSIIDARTALGQMLPLSFGTPPTHQQMRSGKGTEGAGRGSPRGTPDKMKLRIHQVKNDDFKMQGKPDRRRRKWRNKGQEVLFTSDQEKIAAVLPGSGKQVASQLRRVRSDTARKMSSTPAVPAVDDKDEIVDVGDSSDNNYALNMLATMSTMQQNKEQNPLEEATKTSFESPLTISTSLPSNETPNNALLHSPVSLAGAKSLLMLGKDVHVNEAMKSANSGNDRSTEEVTTVESTAVDSLLQLSGAVLQNPLCSDDQLAKAEDNNDTKNDDVATQRRETRSASYSAAEAMLLMGSSSKESELEGDESADATTSENRQQSPPEVFGSGAEQEKRRSDCGPSASEREELVTPQKPPCPSEKPSSLSIDSEATDTDSEATLTPQSPAKSIPSYSSLEDRTEGEAVPIADATVPQIDSRENHSPPFQTAVPNSVKEKKPCEHSMLDAVSNPSSDLDVNPMDKRKFHMKDSFENKCQPDVQLSTSSAPHPDALVKPDSVMTNTSGPSIDNSSCDIVPDEETDDSMPPSKRLKLCPNEDGETEKVRTEVNLQDDSDVSHKFIPDVNEEMDVSELSLKQTERVSVTGDGMLSEIVPEVNKNGANDDQNLVKEQQKIAGIQVQCGSFSPLPKSEGWQEAMDGSQSQPDDNVKAGTDEHKEDQLLVEPEKCSPASTDKVTSWSAFAGVVETSNDENDKHRLLEKVDDVEMETTESIAPSSPAAPSPPPPPPAAPESENVSNRTVEKLQIDDSVKRSSVSSLCSLPHTPDPPIEVDVFEKLPPSPELEKSKHHQRDNETTSSEPQSVKQDNLSSLNTDEELSQQSSVISPSTVGKPNSTGVSVGPQNRLAVSKSSLNRLQHRKHIISHSSKLGRDGKFDSRKRLQPLPSDSQARLFEVDSVSVTNTTSATPSGPPLSHSHSLLKEKKIGSNERTAKEDSHQGSHQSPRHASVRKLKRPGNPSSKSGPNVQKPSKHSSTGKYTICT